MQTQDLVVRGKNAIGIVAVGTNAVGAVAASTFNAVGLVALSVSTRWGW